MMHQAGMGLGIDVHLLAEAAGTSAAQVIANTVVGDYTELDTLARFAEDIDVLTFDHEHVPTRHLRELGERVAVRPGPAALAHAQDKALMRERLTSMGIPCPQFAVCRNADELATFGAQVGWPIIAKTSRGGYDGKGVWKLDAPEQAQAPFAAKPDTSAGEEVVIVAEEFIDFTRELSAVVVRSPSGQAVAYPISETTQTDGVCVETITPAPGLSEHDAAELQAMGLRIAGELEVVGVLAVELMATNDKVVVNELAMRPHNTGHWSIDGAVTSQFENHLRAVLDLPLGAPDLRAPHVVMTNVLGGTEPDLTGALQHVFARDRAIHVHLYGKEVRAGRKVGHVTACDHDLDAALRRARHAAHYLMGDTHA